MRLASGGGRSGVPNSQRKHDPGDAAENQADADQCSDYPNRTRRPLPPDEDAENKRNESIQQHPPGVLDASQPKVKGDLDDSLKNQKYGQDQSQRDHAENWVYEEVDAGYYV